MSEATPPRDSDPEALNSDLIALLALPAMWPATAGQGRTAVVEVLLDVLLSMLRLDWVFVRMADPRIDLARVDRRLDSTACAVKIGDSLGDALARNPLQVPDEIDDPWGGARLRLASVPLAVSGGLVVAASKRPAFPTSRDLLVLRIASNQTSIGVEAARLMETEKRRALQLSKLAAAALEIQSSQSIDDTLRAITDAAREIVGADDAVTRVTPGLDFAQAMKPGRLAAPLIARDGSNLGLIELSHERGGDFDEGDERILVQLAQMAAVAIENARLTDDLRRTRAMAIEADRRKDEFLAMLGHELRNPLAPILTALELMKARGESAAQRERDVIERQVRHVARLVDDLLDVSRITRGKIELRIARMDLSDIVAEALDVARPLIEARQHAVEIDLPPEGLSVEADPVRLGQVLANLLTNAAKYTPPQGSIRLRARRSEELVTITVTDSGIGIAPATLPHVFGMFFQGERTIDRAEGGLGLGLALVRSLVLLHGGSVAARSEGPGKGSEFTVSLPAVAPSGVSPAREAPATPEPRGETRCRILVVDDNADAREMLAEALAHFGHGVLRAGDGPEALALAATQDFDVALLDIGLPVMDGYELAQHLRLLKGPSLRLFALTGYGLETDRAKARGVGFDEHFVKPVDLGALDAAIRGRGGKA